MAKAKDKKAAVLKALKKAGATATQLILLDAKAAKASVADSEETVEVEIEAEASHAWLNGVPIDLHDGVRGRSTWQSQIELRGSWRSRHEVVGKDHGPTRSQRRRRRHL